MDYFIRDGGGAIVGDCYYTGNGSGFGNGQGTCSPDGYDECIYKNINSITAY